MTIDAAAFRVMYPEFSDTTAYPDGAVNRYLLLSQSMLDPQRWGALLDEGTGLYVAHSLTRDKKRATKGGAVSGIVTAKSVDKVSVSMDISATTATDAAQWNTSEYGVQYIEMARMIGAGPMQI